MLKENKKVLKQINKYQKEHLTLGFLSGGCGKSNLVLRNTLICVGLELYKDTLKNTNKILSFEGILKEIIDAMYQEEQALN